MYWFVTLLARFLWIYPIQFFVLSILAYAASIKYLILNSIDITLNLICKFIGQETSVQLQMRYHPMFIHPDVSSWDLTQEITIPKDQILSTDPSCFETLEFADNFAYNNQDYVMVHGMKMYYVEKYPTNRKMARYDTNGQMETIVCLHGNPTWSYMYRNVIDKFTEQGFRVICVDLLGFGRSDKVLSPNYHTLQFHISSLLIFFKKMNLKNVNLVVQDWSGFFFFWGLKWFPNDAIKRLIVTNTAIPPHPIPKELSFFSGMMLYIWGFYVYLIDRYIPISWVTRFLTGINVSNEELKGYDMPFPTRLHKTAVTTLPFLVVNFSETRILDAVRHWGMFSLLEDILPELTRSWEKTQQVRALGAQARDVLKSFKKPVFVIMGKKDPLMGDLDVFWKQAFSQESYVYRKDPVALESAGHYVMEDMPEKFADEIVKFIDATPDSLGK